MVNNRKQHNAHHGAKIKHRSVKPTTLVDFQYVKVFKTLRCNDGDKFLIINNFVFKKFNFVENLFCRRKLTKKFQILI
jgi:hypothetical protein